MKLEGSLVTGFFKKRLNRFVAIIEVESAEYRAHVPNTGRLQELLVEGAEILARYCEAPGRKTEFSLVLVKYGKVWVSVDSANIPNNVIYECLKERSLPRFRAYTDIRREYVYRSSRIDFKLGDGPEGYLLEVKGVSLVIDRTAYFPDAPTLRGRRHVQELAACKSDGLGAGIIFVIQREDAQCFKPNDSNDPGFGEALRAATGKGVELWAYNCIVNKNEIKLFKEVPVIL